MDDDGGPAFPRPTADAHGPNDRTWNASQKGMSLRDYFAAAVMQGFCTGENGDWIMYRGDPGNGYDMIAKRAYILADAMLAERSK